MASENETVMAVCAEWRDCIESADPYVWNDERIAGIVETTKAQQLEYLDRIEAAHDRERETWRGRVKDALAVADQFKGALDHVLNAALFAQQKGAADEKPE